MDTFSRASLLRQSSVYRLILLALTFGNFALSTPILSTPGGGPLGTTPGNSPGTIPAGAGSNSSQSSTRNFSPGIRALDTTLALLVAMLVTSTYAVLISPGTRLLSTSKLPLASIEANIGALLSKAWPDRSTSSVITGGEMDAIRLFYAGKMDYDAGKGLDEKHRAARGVEQCKALPDTEKRIETPSMWLTTGSSLTKSVVQLAVWEWVGIWLAIAVLISTLAFNGFLTGEKGPDSYPRLVVVAIYGLGFCGHSWYVWKTCRSFFTVVSAGSAWSMLNKASFASVELRHLELRLNHDGPGPIFRQVGKPASSSTFPVMEACLVHDIGSSSAQSSPVAVDKSAEMVIEWQQGDIRNTVDAGKSALERIIANVMTLVGIVITTGFSVWTSQSNSDSSSQLGSLALLASLTLGSGAMFSSAIDLRLMQSAFQNVLFLKELMINGETAAHVNKQASKRRSIGFTHNTVDAKEVRMRDLVRFTKWWSGLLFGPAYSLLPTEEDHARQSRGAEFELHVDVRGKDVIFTTGNTDVHCKDSEGFNVESINVCYIPQTTATISSQSGKPEVQVKTNEISQVNKGRTR